MVRIIKKSKKNKIFINYYMIINFYLVIVIEKNFDNLKGFNFLLVSILKVIFIFIGLNEKL